MHMMSVMQAGLLVAETEFALQVESDIAPYKGLLMGLFFMTVGMEISAGLFFAEWKTVVSGIVLLIGGKVIHCRHPLLSLSSCVRIYITRLGFELNRGSSFAATACQ